MRQNHAKGIKLQKQQLFFLKIVIPKCFKNFKIPAYSKSVQCFVKSKERLLALKI